MIAVDEDWVGFEGADVVELIDDARVELELSIDGFGELPCSC